MRISTNALFHSTDRFERKKYQELRCISSSKYSLDNFHRYCLINCFQSGSFHFFFTIDGTSQLENLNGQVYFQVEADLNHQHIDDGTFEQQSICCQIVLSYLKVWVQCLNGSAD